MRAINYTLTVKQDTIEDAIKIKAGHDSYFDHDSKIVGNVVTCNQHPCS